MEPSTARVSRPTVVLWSTAPPGRPNRISLFTTRPGSPESSPLPLPPSDLLAISSTGEMAVSLNATAANPFLTVGTLARVGLAGGAPRELLEHTTDAAWSPDGSQPVAAIQSTTRSGRMEFPPGIRARLSTPSGSATRVSLPTARQYAFVAHPNGGDEGEVQVIGKTGEPRVVSKRWLSLEASPGAERRELWFTRRAPGMMRALWAVTLDAKERLLYRGHRAHARGHHVAPDGRVLAHRSDSPAVRLRAGSLRDKTERSLSWFDWATGLTMSADQRLVAFTESARARPGIRHLRPADKRRSGLPVADGAGVASSHPTARRGSARRRRNINVVPISSTPRWAVLCLRCRLFTIANADRVGTERGREPRSYQISVQVAKYRRSRRKGQPADMCHPTASGSRSSSTALQAC